MPTWTADEQAAYFNSSNFESEYSKEIAQRAYRNIQFFGGSIRNNIEAALTEDDPVRKVEEALLTKGELVCARFFKAGFGGTEDVVSDILVHRNPEKSVGGGYNYNVEPCAYSFASPYVLRRLLRMKDSMLVTEARNKYSSGTFRGGDDVNEFELLCLHGFKISGVSFLAVPLTADADEMNVVFPPKQVLALNWREQKEYLQANTLYIPPYGNLESGDSFCLIKIKRRWTLVILQCTIAEDHPVKQNGIRSIYDAFMNTRALTIQDTVIIFMIPSPGKLRTKLRTKERLVVQKGDEEVKRITVAVKAQYKIENSLVTVDVN